MPSYPIKIGVSKAAKIFRVNRSLIKTWTFHFGDYLNPKASPRKGFAREFTIDDLSVLSYISFYWENNPDIESIKIGLNNNSHLDPPFNAIREEATPIFREFSDSEILKNEFVAGGEFGVANKLELADSYKTAGDLLVDNILDKNENWYGFFPVIFTYRHSIELYFKAIIKEEKNTHDLISLLDKFNQVLLINFKITPPDWFDNMIKSLNEFDPTSTAFRYGEFEWTEEMIIDLCHFKKVMKWSSESFHRVFKSLEMNNNK